jgi:DNA-binding NarL/FixJ family response regulator
MSLERDPDPTRVLLVDRAGLSRAALATLLSGIPGVVLVGEVGEPDDVDAVVRQTSPDLVIVDDRLLPDAGDHAARMIVVGADDDPGYAARAERYGAIAWIPKERADSLLPPLLSGAT